ncbi:MAG: ATP-dependent zinc metalloprotease FtsH [Bacilli bacterium]|nr:ATP-dependent zinc metalloprotease FtsH [Bacilli bacterium]
MWNRVTVWSEDELNNTLRLVNETDKEDPTLGYTYIKYATISTNEKAATIVGNAYDKKENKTYNFTVNVSNERLEAENGFFDHLYKEGETVAFPYFTDGGDKQVGVTPVYHINYHTCFEKKIKEAIDENKGRFTPEEKKGFGLFVNDNFQVSWWDAWGPTIIMLIITILVAFFLFRGLSRSIGNTNAKALSFNQSRARRVDQSKVRFKDVAGCDEEKAEMEEVVQYLKEPGKFSKLGAKLPKGILLVGPPGTGKTLLAKAVAGEAGVPFYSISGSDFVEMFVGVGAGRVRDMFAKAKQTAPCLIFIDEIDAVGRQRGAGLGGGNDEREQTLNQLLVEMDGFEDNSGIIVIAATNRDDVLDPALLRAGRFDRQITVSLPDKKGREAIFKVHSANKKIDPSVDFSALAKRTVGFSGADIENIMNEAAILAVRENREIVTTKDIDEAIDRRIAGPAKKSRSMTERERKTVAFHEAGHAIIGLTLPDSDKVQKITIIPRGQTGGHVLMTPENDRFILTKKELFARIVGYLGGRSSEEIFFKDISTGAHNDIEVATRIARLMVTEYGMSKLGPIQYEKDTGSVFLGRDYTNSQKNFSAQVALEIDKAVREIIDEAHEEAKKIITKRKADVTLIANTLLEHESITAEQIDYLLKNKKLPTEKKAKPAKVEPKAEEKKEEPAKK